MSPAKAEYLIFENSDEMWKFLAVKWRAISSGAIEEKGFFAVALSGGTTPVGFYRRLSDAKGLPWDKTHIFLVDERFVPSFHEQSNYRMLRENLINRIHISPHNIHPVSTVESSPNRAAAIYEEELRNFFKLAVGDFPEFDLILLGIGEDGHTASLFPGSEALSEKSRLAVPVVLNKSLHDRVTITLPVINNSRNVIFLVSGSRKAAIARKLIDEKDRHLPASMVNPEKGKLFFLIEKEVVR